MRKLVPEEEQVAQMVSQVVYRKEYRSDLHGAMETLAPDVVLVDVSLKYAILAALCGGTPLVVLCHILYGAHKHFADSRSTEFEELNREARRCGLQEFDSLATMTEAADRVLVFSYASFDTVSSDEVEDRIRHVGPLRPSSHTPSGWSRRFPERKLVLISLGTTYQRQGSLLQRLSDACGMLEIEALMTTGRVPTSTLDLSENVTAVPFVDHDEVLPRADLLISHAGHGTVAAGLKYGVPMICTPLGRDQYFNASRVNELRLGVALDADSSIDEFRRVIRKALDDMDLKRRSEAFAASLETHPGIDEALDVIETTAAGRRARQ